MGTDLILGGWIKQVHTWWPGLHGHQAKALATFSWAMACSGQCQLSQVALATPGAARVPSHQRRWERLVAHPHLDPATLASALVRVWLAECAGQRLFLLLDETPLGPWLCCMQVSLWLRHHALPLAWTCYRPGALPASQPQIVHALLEQVAACLPAPVHVTLLTDRGLAWPELLDWCGQLGWHYVVRIQEQTAIRRRGATRHRPARAWAPCRGGRPWGGAVEAFETAGWRTTHLVAAWPRAAQEPWLLLTDLPPRPIRCQEYGHRMGAEHGFRDEKSHGLNWQKSQVRQPEHASRLRLGLMLALVLLIAWGLEVLRRHWRSVLERRDRRSLSVVQLGWRWNRWCCFQGLPPPLATPPPINEQISVGR